MNFRLSVLRFYVAFKRPPGAYMLAFVSSIIFVSCRALELSILAALVQSDNESVLAKSLSDLRDELRS